MNRQHSNRGCNNDGYQSDELNDARSEAGLPETYNDEEPCVTVDELATLLHNAELTTRRSASAMSNTYVNSVPRRSNNDVLGDIDRYDPEGTPGSRSRNVRFQSPPLYDRVATNYQRISHDVLSARLNNEQRSGSLNEIYDRPQNDLVTSSRGALNRGASLSPRVLSRHATNPFVTDYQPPATPQSSRPAATITEIVPSRSNSRMSCDRVDAMSRASTNAYRSRDSESRRSLTSRRNDSRDPETYRLRDNYPTAQRNLSLNNPSAYTHYMPNS
ncbi:unnamed protein product [Trichogramma brassicae]|uniref:Uncharacterized protein n=1 Tax=Trichogramma brassicae TaxID=86971 RepID=A0A6H5IRX6_9HYME|nr:unnamed protein product [Trichogramma brassicae]